jgi:DNA-binding transcriptional LysR family regulator
MAIRSKNLNLLPLLQALLEERSIVAAADKVGLSQPAMSAALARIRETFDDPILVRVGRSMQPTPRALEIQDQLNDLCAKIEVLFQTNSFDPAKANTTFRIAAPTYIGFLLADKWVTHLSNIAPNIKIDFVDMPNDLTEWLDNGSIDIAVAKPMETWKNLRVKHLFNDHAVTLVSKKHPFYSKTTVTPAELSTNSTIEYNFSATYPFISKTKSSTFEFAGFEQNNQISSVSQFDAIALATQHPLFALAPHSFATRLADIFQLKVLEIADNDSNYSTSMIWSFRTDQSLPHNWLRSEIENALLQL